MSKNVRGQLRRAAVWWSAGLVVAALALWVGELSVATYRQMVRVGHGWPDAMADALIAVLALSFLLAGWGRLAGRAMGAVVAPGVGVVLAYGSSEVFKVVVGQDRPCRAILPVVECPPVGDWSFPSNHATIAFAVATAIVLMTRRRWVWAVYGLAALTAAARVVEGVHYPHDVVAGAMVGICTVVACATVLTDPVNTALSARGGHSARPRSSKPWEDKD